MIRKIIENIILRQKEKGSFLGVYGFSDLDKSQKAREHYFNLNNEIDLNNVLMKINEFNKNNYCVCINLNPLNDTQRKNENVVSIQNIFIDLDDIKDYDENTKILKYLEENNIEYSYNAISGNGYHILIPINLKINEQKIVKEFLKNLNQNISSYVDISVNDLSRVFRCPESFHYKNGTPFKLKTLEFKEIDSKQIFKNSEIIKNLVTKKNNTNNNNSHSGEDLSFQEILKDKEIRNLFYNVHILKKFPKDFNPHELDRSKAEQSLVDKLVMKGIIEFYDINKIMQNCKIGKWQDSSESYKKNTFEKALGNYNSRYIEPNIKNNIAYLNNPDIVFERLGCGIHNNIFYYGHSVTLGIYQNNCIITSDKNMYVSRNKDNDEIRDIFKLNYRDDFAIDTLDYKWSNESIQLFLSNNEIQIGLNEIYNKILEINKYYMVYENPIIHSYVACDIIATYFLPIWQYRGRTFLYAEYGSGKTKQSTIYKLLSFNSIMAGNITPATMDRIIESTCGTLIVDNMDNLGDELKKNINQFIEVFYQSSGKSIKAEGSSRGRFKARAFQGYSSMIINNLTGLSPVTESRCHTINLFKTTNEEITRRKINEKDKRWQSIRNELYIYGLNNWKKIQESYDALKVTELHSRELEITEPILAIANLISEKTYNDLINFFVENFKIKRNLSKLDNEWEIALWETLDELLGENLQINIKTTELKQKAKKRIQDASEENLNKFSLWAGKVIKRYPIKFRKYRSNGITCYEYNRKNLDEILRLKEIKEVNSQKEC